MKIAVLAIAKNEEKFVERCVNSASDADTFILVDTGSTDKTVELAQDNGCVVHKISVSPWNFSIARNTALSLVPSDVDIVVNLDLDEILTGPWRKAIERIFSDSSVTRLHYDYIWSFNEDGSPNIRYYRDMIHRRDGYMWKYHCHETLFYQNGKENIFTTDDFTVEHHPDHEKSRSQYLPLLERAVIEYPNDDRIAHYFARELFFHKRLKEASVEFERHLQLPSAKWSQERSESYLYLSRCYEEMSQTWKAFCYSKNAIDEAPERTETWYRAAYLTYKMNSWLDCLFYVQKALITESPKTYMKQPINYLFLYDIGFISAFNLKQYDLAAKMIENALSLSPNDERLISNRERLKEKWQHD